MRLFRCQQRSPGQFSPGYLTWKVATTRPISHSSYMP